MFPRHCQEHARTHPNFPKSSHILGFNVEKISCYLVSSKEQEICLFCILQIHEFSTSVRLIKEGNKLIGFFPRNFISFRETVCCVFGLSYCCTYNIVLTLPALYSSCQGEGEPTRGRGKEEKEFSGPEKKGEKRKAHFSPLF